MKRTRHPVLYSYLAPLLAVWFGLLSVGPKSVTLCIELDGHPSLKQLFGGQCCSESLSHSHSAAEGVAASSDNSCGPCVDIELGTQFNFSTPSTKVSLKAPTASAIYTLPIFSVPALQESSLHLTAARGRPPSTSARAALSSTVLLI